MYLMEHTDIIPDGYEQLFTYVPSPSLSISISKLIDITRSGRISKDEIEIIKFLFEFTMASIDQLSLLFEPDKDVLKQSLDKLVKARVLNKFCLVNKEKTFREDAFLIYCIDKGGAELLNHYKNGESYDNFKVEDIILPSSKVWKRLTTVDFYLRLLESCPNKLAMFQVSPTVFLGKRILRPHFALGITQGNSFKGFVGEIVFANDVGLTINRSERFVEKTVQLELLLCTNVYKKMFGFETPPTLLIIAEDDDTAEKAAAIIASTDIQENTSFRITTPDRLKKSLSDKGVFLALKKDKLVSSRNKIFVDD